MKKIRVVLPSDWSSVTLKQYTEWMRLHSGDYDTLQRITNTVSIIGKISIEDARTISIEDLKTFYAAIGWMNNGYTGIDIKDLTNKKGLIQIEVAGVKYTAEPNVSKWSAGSILDCRENMGGEEARYNTDNALASILTPKGKKYGEIPVNEVAEHLYDNITMDVVFTLTGFFLKIYGSYLNSTLRSLNKEINNQTKNLLEEITTPHTSSIGDGL